jgi:hypothetical protein
MKIEMEVIPSAESCQIMELITDFQLLPRFTSTHPYAFIAWCQIKI